MSDFHFESCRNKFLDSKRKWEEEGFKFYYLFEIFFLPELRDRYAKRLLSLEEKLKNIDENDPKKLGYFLMAAHVKKNFEENLTGVKFIHCATKEGFSKQDFGYIGIKQTSEPKASKKKHFIDVFKEMVSNKELIPDKSCIVMNNDFEHLMPANSNRYKLDETKESPQMKKRDKLGKAKGQKVLTDFFSSTKPTSLPYKKPEEGCQFKVEEIVQALRGDDVKIMWLPKHHYELDPSQYVAVILLNELARETAGCENVDVGDCIAIIDRLPNEIWKIAVDQVKKCEEFYLKLLQPKAQQNQDEED